MTASAVVFGYGDVGVRCTHVLLKHGVDVRLVVTHEDDPAEVRWYSSLAEFSSRLGLAVTAPANIDDKLLYRLHALAPDFIFSFYYRQLLPDAVLATATRGALNMHGSLLPRFRGRAPVNWAVLHGVSETGATLHYMVSKVDAGDIVDQMSVSVGENDTAHEVFLRVASAAESVLARSLAPLIEGSAARRPQDLSQGEYCGRRRPEDGRIDWGRSAREIHNLVRAVAPPFPGAFGNFDGERWLVTRTRVLATPPGDSPPLQLRAQRGQCVITCRDGQQLEMLEAWDSSGPVDMAGLLARLQRAAITVG